MTGKTLRAGIVAVRYARGSAIRQHAHAQPEFHVTCLGDGKHLGRNGLDGDFHACLVDNGFPRRCAAQTTQQCAGRCGNHAAGAAADSGKGDAESLVY